MPAGCATWPGFRTKSQRVQSSASGVIDIIEGTLPVSFLSLLTYSYAFPLPVGVNLHEVNQATLHTTSGCQMPPDSQRLQSGYDPFPHTSSYPESPLFSKKIFYRTTLSTICDTAVNNNTGCGVSFDKSGPSYGTPFNINTKGGYYVMVRSRMLGIRVYFWPRDNSIDVPPEIRECGSEGGSLYPDPSWGIPAADFPMSPDLCNYDEHFDAHQIIFSLTFCVSPERLLYLPSAFARAQLKSSFPQGDWAGNTWPSSGCGNSTCENCKRPLAYDGQLLRSSSHFPSVVNNNPSAFSEAYWAINSLRVYTPASPY
jgi:hypothetical protein